MGELKHDLGERHTFRTLGCLDNQVQAFKKSMHCRSTFLLPEAMHLNA